MSFNAARCKKSTTGERETVQRTVNERQRCWIG